MRHRFIPLAAFCTLCLPLSAAHSALIIGGNTNPSNVIGGPGIFQGSINAAVYDTVGGSAGDTFGTGIGMDALIGGVTGSYLYLYQVSNSGPGSPSIDRASIALKAAGASSITSVFAIGYDFLDPGVMPVDATNDLGTDAPSYTQDAPFDATAATVGFAMTAGGVAPSGMTISSSSFAALFAGGLPPGTHSILFGFQSNGAPALDFAAIVDGVGANGTAPAPVPEPGMLAGLLSLLPLGLVFFRRRQR